MRGDQQCGDLEPYVRFVAQVFQSVEHSIEVAGADAMVEVLREGLEVDVSGVHVRIQIQPGRRQYVAGSDRDRVDTALMASIGHVDGVLHEDGRIVVGEGDAATAQPTRRVGKGFRGRGVGECVDLSGFGDVPVLAELARKIASGRSEGEHRRARQKMIQRLLLHRINTESA